tara:strand:- start:1766 stop:2344 length:579 start_codon:yes stop_codon:yes gene_type:complete
MFYYLLGAITSIIIVSYKNNILYNFLLCYENFVDKYKCKNNHIYIEIIKNNTLKKYYDLTKLNSISKNETIILNWYINNQHNKMIINSKNMSNIIMASIIVTKNNTINGKSHITEHEITNDLNSFILPNTNINLNNNTKNIWVSLLNNKFNTHYNTNTEFIYNIILQDVSIHKSNHLFITTDTQGFVKIIDK